MGIVAAVVDFLFLFFLWGLILVRVLFVVVVEIFFFFFFFCWGNFGGDGLVFVADFWWKVDVWLYRRETEKGREERD